MKSSSKKAFEHNLKAEMHAGKPQAQSLAIAYDMKRKNRKKMTKGGAISASNEKRPMPDSMSNDRKMAMENRGDKPAHNDNVLDNPTVKQAQMNSGRKVLPIKHPKMVPSDVLSSRLYSYEDELQRSARPGNPSEQPPKADDEEGADRQGPDSRDLHMKRMAEGGEINDVISMKRADEDNLQHPAHLEDDNDTMKPSDDEIMADHMEMLAEGGMAEMDDQPDHEEAEEHHASIAAAIMAKRDRKASQMSDSDIDEMMRLYASGGEVDLMSHHEEEPNNEDQMSFEALKKESYNDSDLEMDQLEDSNEHGDDIESDKHDMIDSIRRKMKSKRQF